MANHIIYYFIFLDADTQTDTDMSLPVLPPLVLAERLTRGESPPADGAPTARRRFRRHPSRLSSQLATPVRRRRLCRRSGKSSGLLLRRGRLAVTGLVAAERLVGGEGLPADRALEPKLQHRVRGSGTTWPSALLLPGLTVAIRGRAQTCGSGRAPPC